MNAPLRETWARILGFLRGRRPDDELEAELVAHFDLAVEENLQRGMDSEEARRRAAILGCMVPARRAMRTDPVTALRHD